MKAELVRTQERGQAADLKRGVYTRLINSSRDLLRGVQTVKPYTGALPTLRKGETALDAVEARRRRLRELAADASRVNTAPFPSAVAKAKAKERIEALARRGEPDGFLAVERGEAVQWPTTLLRLPDGGAVSVPDVEAWFARIHGKAMLAAEEQAIDACADDAAALTDQQRTEAMAQIRRDMLAVQREEVAFLHQANRAGAALLYRPETDYRALLQLSDDMPAPPLED
ncbi:hypothetical protein [Bradyrhizobium viridifuturi]|uniref:hypothetical protein n=1 Tax=Bradyrhizobium viridifuturi TaxID=1654716 RepID=UPI00067EA6DE|nr:hypothetical protein [Bradyrhizobium viridifuturi]